MVHKITFRERAEGALRQSERRFALFMQNLPGAAWVKDLQGKYVYANQEAERIFQTRLDDLLGKTDEEVFPPDVARQFRGNDGRAVRVGRGIQTIETLPQPDGIHHHSIVSKFPIADDDGKPVMVGGVAFDITEQRTAEEALRRTAKELRTLNEALMQSNEGLRATQDHLQLIVSNMAAAVTLCSRDLRYVWVSRSYSAWLGLPPEQIAGRPIRDVIGEQGYRDIYLYMQRALSGERVEYTTQVNFLGPGQRWIEAVYVPTRAQTGEVDGWIAVVTDITDRKRTEEQMLQTQRLESLGILAGGIAHDFNNLLVGILGNASLALDVLGANSPAKKMLEDVISASERAAGLNRQLLAYAGKQPLHGLSIFQIWSRRSPGFFTPAFRRV